MDYPAPRRPRSYRTARPAVPRPLPQRRRGRDTWHAAVSLALLVGVALGAVVAFEHSMDGKLYPGVRIGGVDVGGLARAEALARLGAARDLTQTLRLTLTGGGHSWALIPAQVGTTFDIPATVAAAYRLGRSGDAVDRLQDQLQLFLNGRDLALHGHYSAVAVQHYLHTVAFALYRAPRPVALAIVPPGTVLQTTEQNGQRLDIARAAAATGAALMRGQPAVLSLPVAVSLPPPSLAAARGEVARLSHLLAAHLMVAVGTTGWPVARADLAAMIRLTTTQARDGLHYTDSVDRRAVMAYLEPHLAALDRHGRDARVLYTGATLRVVPAQEGAIVDRAAAADALAAAIASGSDETVVLPQHSDPGIVTTAAAQAVVAHLRLVLRATVVWLPERHWAIPPARLAAALTLHRTVVKGAVRLTPRIDPIMLAADLPGAAALATVPPRDAAVVQSGSRFIVVPGHAGHRPNYAALGVEIAAAPLDRAVYHLPLATVLPRISTAAAQAAAAAHTALP